GVRAAFAAVRVPSGAELCREFHTPAHEHLVNIREIQWSGPNLDFGTGWAMLHRGPGDGDLLLGGIPEQGGRLPTLRRDLGVRSDDSTGQYTTQAGMFDYVGDRERGVQICRCVMVV